LRRLKTDKSVISDLPDKVEMKVFCRLTKEQASLYQAAVDDAMHPIESAEGIERRGIILALLLRLKQICNHPAHYLADGSPLPKRSGKLNRLTELLEEIREAGERVLIFSQFTEMAGLLQAHVQETFGKEALFLHGAVSRKGRDELVRRFQSDDGPWAFILSLKAGGTGLNLTNANQVIHFDRWWNPAVEDQATDRAFRIGQKRNVVVHKFICSGTLEERIDTTIDRKKDVAGRVVGSGEQWLTDLSDRELRDILTLSDDAVED
jgi:SNF2 family DNA or RNA helicase